MAGPPQNPSDVCAKLARPRASLSSAAQLTAEAENAQLAAEVAAQAAQLARDAEERAAAKIVADAARARKLADLERDEALRQKAEEEARLKVRLAVYLLRLVVVRGIKDTGYGYFVESADSQEEIANRVGGARQRVNAILKEWEREGALSIGRDGLTITETRELLEVARASGFDIDAYLEAWQGGWKSPFYKGSGFKA